MYTQVEKPKENKSRAVANSVTQQKRNLKQGFRFVDNRPKIVIQRYTQPVWVNERNVIQRANDKIAVAAEKLEGEFLWTLPGGLLEYSTIITHWEDYRSLLLNNLDKNIYGQVRYISMGINNLLIIQPEGYIETCKSMLNEIRLLIAPGNQTEDYMTLKDEFTDWLNGGSNPKHLNCWEAVIFTCEQAGVIDKKLLLEYITGRKEKEQATDSEQLFRKFILGRSIEALLDSDEDEVIPKHDLANAERGDILCFWVDDCIHHVALYFSEDVCMSIWAEDTLSFKKTSVSGLIKKCGSQHVEIVKK